MRQPKLRASVGRSEAVIIPATLRLVWLMPIAVALSRRGNQLSTAFVATVGKQPQPNPASTRTPIAPTKPPTAYIPRMKPPATTGPMKSIFRTPILSTSQPAGIWKAMYPKAEAETSSPTSNLLRLRPSMRKGVRGATAVLTR